MERQEELRSRAEYSKSAPIDDYLTEDPAIHNQKFYILSYLLPDAKNELTNPIIKFRGAYRTHEECSKRIERLKIIDTYFNMYICEVGRFGSLLPDDEFLKMDDVDIKYRDDHLNTLVKEYRKNKDKADLHFEERKKNMMEKANHEGTREGQQEIEKDPEAVKLRLKSYIQNKEQVLLRLKEIDEEILKNQKLLESQ
jgi:hypothetical protein